MSDPETSQSQLAISILNQYESPSGVETAAASVQTFAQDEEKKESGSEDITSVPHDFAIEDGPKLTEEPSGSNIPDKPTIPSAPMPQPVPQTLVTFLLVSGKRRTMSFEPKTTIGRVKELVWNAWPNGM